jgi:hypothetical protein
MTGRERWAVWRRTMAVRHCLFATGWLLILVSPVVGLLPGPGGVFVFAAGVALLLETSPRARRLYVRVKRRWPRVGEWTDWGLRRRSWKRRRARLMAGAAE